MSCQHAFANGKQIPNLALWVHSATKRPDGSPSTCLSLLQVRRWAEHANCKRRASTLVVFISWQFADLIRTASATIVPRSGDAPAAAQAPCFALPPERNLNPDRQWRVSTPRVLDEAGIAAKREGSILTRHVLLGDIGATNARFALLANGALGPVKSLDVADSHGLQMRQLPS